MTSITTPASPSLFAFVGGEAGDWRITALSAVRGEGLTSAGRLTVLSGDASASSTSGTSGVAWVLRGVTSHQRYTTRAEHEALIARGNVLGRPEATRAALIPIRKSPAWWALTQDERRSIFEEQSRHIAASLPFIPAIARRLHHGRDLGEPFDFLTWFEYAPEHETAFEQLVAQLRTTEEWAYVDRELDIRLSR